MGAPEESLEAHYLVLIIFVKKITQREKLIIKRNVFKGGPVYSFSNFEQFD